MHLSRSMVATLAVLGATCALAPVTVSQAATALKVGTYDSAKPAVAMRVAKDRKTLVFIDGFCIKNHVRAGTWKVSKLRIVRGAFAYSGRVRVSFINDDATITTKTLHFKIGAHLRRGAFVGSVSDIDSPAECTTLKFTAKYDPNPKRQ
jgi:hypothetical protein